MKILTVSALVCALMALTTADGESDIVKRSSCPERFTLYNGRCYGYNSRGMTWANAEKRCQDYSGGHLASVRNIDELRIIQEVIKKWTGGKSPVTWIRGSDARQAGNWVSSDGSSISSSYWAPEQPDRSGNCLTINYEGVNNFARRPCSEGHPSVCEV